MKFQLIKDVVFILLIRFKMPIIEVLNSYEQDTFYAQVS